MATLGTMTLVGLRALSMSTRVSVRDLKNHLSNYVRRIRAGEEVVLTCRRRPVVRMLPVPESSTGGLAAVPLVRWNGEKPGGGSRRPRVDQAAAANMVLEDRR